MPVTMSHREMFTREFWDERYRSHSHLWSGRPNLRLVEYADELVPGRALDVGCGEGADAVWLAERGWEVTGTDVSGVALERAAEHAAGRDPAMAARIAWCESDLFGDEWGPFADYDLVNSQYLHLPPQERARSMARLAGAVRPGGHLLVATHHPSDLEVPGLRPNRPELFCTAPELAGLLDAADWEILVAAAPERTEPGPDDQPVVIRDAVLLARRATRSDP
jgi:SAM-dependent methyltransferase